MAKSEQDKLIDEWIAWRNSHIGEIKIPHLGEYPPDITNYYGSLLNEWITTDLIRHYCDAMGDRNPLWRSQEYARATRWGGIIAPPTFTNSILQNAPFWFEPERQNKFKAWRFAPSGHRRELFHWIRPGDRLRAVHRYLGIKEVETEFPPPAREFHEHVERALINQKDDVVAVLIPYYRVILNHLETDKYPYLGVARKLRRLTDEERDSIYRGYDNETRRGAGTLYWEDVAVGEELKMHAIGPMAVWDIGAFFTAEPGHCVGFEIWWERIKLWLEHATLDPEINAYVPGGEYHFRESKAASAPTGGRVAGANQILDGLICRMICNWMGDDGFVKLMDTWSHAVPLRGEVFLPKGRVAKKYVEGDEHLVDLEISCENMDGILLQSGSATVKLISRAERKF